MNTGLQAQDVFGFLRPEQVDAISDSSERVSYVPGDIIYEEGAPATHLFTILSGEVTLRLRGRGGASILIDQLSKGELFGSCVCFYRDSYSLTAQCTRESELLRIDNSVLVGLMDRDLKMGYALQTRISEVYFNRYIETMQKLQAIVMSVPIESDRDLVTR